MVGKMIKRYEIEFKKQAVYTEIKGQVLKEVGETKNLALVARGREMGLQNYGAWSWKYK